MDRQRSGVWLGVAAYTFWGVSPVFWNLVEDIAALDVLAYRIILALPIGLAVVAVRRRRGIALGAYASRRSVLLAVAAATLISVNWGVFLWAVRNGHIVEASLGYFINPLVSVALGVVVLEEHLRPLQRLAVGIATVGVVAMTIVLGVLPWISLALAGSFGLYGLVKKLPGAAPAMEGLLGEILILTLPAVAFLAVGPGGGSVGGVLDAPTALWLIGTGLVTIGPLWMFGAAAQRIPLSTIGLLQYVTPTLQLAVGVALYGESVAGGELVGFALVWIALGVFVRDQVAIARRLRMAT